MSLITLTISQVKEKQPTPQETCMFLLRRCSIRGHRRGMYWWDYNNWILDAFATNKLNLTKFVFLSYLFYLYNIILHVHICLWLAFIDILTCIYWPSWNHWLDKSYCFVWFLEGLCLIKNYHYYHMNGLKCIQGKTTGTCFFCCKSIYNPFSDIVLRLIIWIWSYSLKYLSIIIWGFLSTCTIYIPNLRIGMFLKEINCLIDSRTTHTIFRHMQLFVDFTPYNSYVTTRIES